MLINKTCDQSLKEKLVSIDLKMMQMLELAEMDLKAAIINVFKDFTEMIVIQNNHMRNLSRKMQTIKKTKNKKQMEILIPKVQYLKLEIKI